MIKLPRINESEWSWEKAKHLLNRAGFGGRKEEIAAFSRAGAERSVDLLFEFSSRSFAEPDWLAEYEGLRPRMMRAMTPEKRKAMRKRARDHLLELQLGWIQWMAAAPTPADMLRDRMTFFWHGHFATSARKVKLPPLIHFQVRFLFEHATSNFGDLLHGIVRDPAMLRYLDNNQNHRGRPNENLARELMELFSLGPGHYTEADVKAAARALTGWSADPLHFVFRRRQHDFGPKAFLGHSGDLDGDGIVDIILEQPDCAEFITRKLLAYFGFHPVSAAVVRALSANLYESNYQLEPFLKSMFLHPDFYAANVVGNEIKSPVQLVVGTARLLNLEVSTQEFYARMLSLMGQAPYLPPNVKGWPGGRAWIDTSRLISRRVFGELIGRGGVPDEIAGGRRRAGMRRSDRKMKVTIDFDPALLTPESDAGEGFVSDLEEVLLAVKLTPEERRAMLAKEEIRSGKVSSHRKERLLVGHVLSSLNYQLC